MQNLYSENELVEQFAIDTLKKMRWEWCDCYNEFEQGSSPLARENRGEVVLIARLRSALERLNPDVSSETINNAIEELTRSRATMSCIEANWEIYRRLIKDGVKVTITDPDSEEETDGTVKVIDWDNPENNNFLLASQFSITGEMYTKRPDAIGFINGLPLVVMEFKRIDKNLYDAYNDNIRNYKDTIPHLFWYNALIILSNGSETKLGSLTTEWEHFAEWKKVESEDEPGTISLETVLKGTCDHRRLLDIIENFTLFMEARGGLIKLVAKNHQYLGVNKSVKALQGMELNQGKLGVFWHTQGAGKSISMVFFAQKVLRKIPGGWRFVIVTDRKELDNQIYKNFADCRGVVTQGEVHAEDVKDLRQLLREDHRYIFTLIQKFQTNNDEPHRVLSDGSNIIVITDESHRSQYDTLALNMRTALPNAAFIAFTGTPLIKGKEERTREVFGEYVSEYNFKQSVEDGATVPLHYEKRGPGMQLTNKHLNADVLQIVETVELDETQEIRLEQKLPIPYNVITREKRLEAIAEDIVSHFMGRGYRGKAMVISIDKATAVKMYDKVQKYWVQYLDGLQTRLGETTTDKERQALRETIQYMEETNMRVVVSKSLNEVSDLKARGVDISQHRKRMNTDDLDTKFKEPEDPFRIVFVCAMWMTGFDVPACSTIYLDKLQRNHTLMQTIARANRVFEDKVNGLIVDYIGIFQDIEQALAIYGTDTDPEGSKPIRDKSELVKEITRAIVEIKEFCANRSVDLSKISAPETERSERLRLITDAVNRILVDDEIKGDYLQHAREISRLYKAILPDPAASDFNSICTFINIIAQKIRNLTSPPPDTTNVMEQIEHLLDRSIVPTGYIIEAAAGDETDSIVDLSQMDMDQLQERFRTQHKQIEVERLRGAITRKLSDIIPLNRTRMDFQKRFEKIIAEYNAGTGGVDVCFQQLIALVRELNAEEQRAIVEQLCEEELAVFDLLIRPKLDLTEAEKDQVKSISRQLLETLKREKLLLDWRKRQQSRAAVKVTIEDILEVLPLSRYTDDMYQQKCEVVYQHIYDSYHGAGNSIYGAAA